MFGSRRPYGLGLNLRGEGPQRSTRRRVPFDRWETLTRRHRQPLVGVASVALHVAILLLALLSPRLDQPSSTPSTGPQPSPVRMVYLQPEEPAPQPRPKQPAKPPLTRETPPKPAVSQAVPEREAEPPSSTDLKAPDHDMPAASSPSARRPDDGGATETAAAELEDAMVSEARRLFGPRPPPMGALAGPLRSGLPVGLMRGGAPCAWGGGATETIERPDTGVIEGIVRTESSGQPIPGAFLQMLGTGSATFADAGGHYRLIFDPALIDACRSQLVRVTAPGYRARTMILTLGHQSDNTIDLPSKGGR